MYRRVCTSAAPNTMPPAVRAGGARRCRHLHALGLAVSAVSGFHLQQLAAQALGAATAGELCLRQLVRQLQCRVECDGWRGSVGEALALTLGTQMCPHSKLFLTRTWTVFRHCLTKVTVCGAREPCYAAELISSEGVPVFAAAEDRMSAFRRKLEQVQLRPLSAPPAAPTRRAR